MTGKIAPNDGRLMEVAHLDGIAWRQGGFDASSAVANDRLNNPARAFKVIDSPKIVSNRFPTNREPVKIPVEIGRSEEHNATPYTKKEPIDNQDDRLRSESGGLESIRRQLFPDPGNAFLKGLT